MTTLTADRDGRIDIEQLSDGTLAAMRCAAVAHGQTGVADALEKLLKDRAEPELYRHSRRRQR